MMEVLNQLSEQWLAQLKASGYRLTGPRYYVVEVLAKSAKALTAMEIYTIALTRYPSLGLVSVYRTLEKLESLGLIQRVHQRDNCHAYVAASNGHEHLLLCGSCGKVIFFRGDDLNSLVTGVEKESGFQVQEHWLQLVGLCVDCQTHHQRVHHSGSR